MLDHERQKGISKTGMAISLGALAVATLDTKNSTMRHLQSVAGISLAGFALWNCYLCNKPRTRLPDQTTHIPEAIHTDSFSIHINSFYLELTLNGKLSSTEVKLFETKIEEILTLYPIPQIHILIDINALEGIELKAAWEEMVFGIRHFSQFKKIAVVGHHTYENISVDIANHLTKIPIRYFEIYDEAKAWLLDIPK